MVLWNGLDNHQGSIDQLVSSYRLLAQHPQSLFMPCVVA